MKTVFITGASSGIGRETALFFQEKGWNVIATMRNPQKETLLQTLPHVKVLPLDVTDLSSIHSAIEEGIRTFSSIDVLINNAGYYTVGPLEATTTVQIKRQLDTNLLGLIETTKAILPHMREHGGGTIINLSSIAGIISIPLQSLYHATKFAIEGFSESLQYEVAPFNIQIKLIEPGTINTNFCRRSMIVADYEDQPSYRSYSDRVIQNLISNSHAGSDATGVAKTIYKAATDGKKKMRYPTGKMKQLILLHKLLPLPTYRKVIQSSLEG